MKQITNFMNEYDIDARKQLGDEIVAAADDANYKADALLSINITNILIDQAIKAAGSGEYSLNIETNDNINWETLCNIRSNGNLRQLLARHLKTFNMILEERDTSDRAGEVTTSYFVSWGNRGNNGVYGKLVLDENWDITPYKPWLPDADKGVN